MISIEDGCKCGLPPVDFAPRATKCGSIVKESIKRDRMRNEYMEGQTTEKKAATWMGTLPADDWNEDFVLCLPWTWERTTRTEWKQLWQPRFWHGPGPVSGRFVWLALMLASFLLLLVGFDLYLLRFCERSVRRDEMTWQEINQWRACVFFTEQSFRRPSGSHYPSQFFVTRRSVVSGRTSPNGFFRLSIGRFLWLEVWMRTHQNVPILRATRSVVLDWIISLERYGSPDDETVG